MHDGHALEWSYYDGFTVCCPKECKRKTQRAKSLAKFGSFQDRQWMSAKAHHLALSRGTSSRVSNEVSALLDKKLQELREASKRPLDLWIPYRDKNASLEEERLKLERRSSNLTVAQNRRQTALHDAWEELRPCNRGGLYFCPVHEAIEYFDGDIVNAYSDTWLPIGPNSRFSHESLTCIPESLRDTSFIWEIDYDGGRYVTDSYYGETEYVFDWGWHGRPCVTEIYDQVSGDSIYTWEAAKEIESKFPTYVPGQLNLLDAS